ncbi:hypothetical protein Tco_0658579 [Tanacetum coccineum]
MVRVSSPDIQSLIIPSEEVGFLPEVVFEVREEFVLLLDENGGSFVSDLESEFSSAVIAMNSSNSEKKSSSRRVPSMEWRILFPSSRRASKSSSKISSMTSILKHVSSFDSVKKWSSQDERNFAIFFHFENNEIGRKGLRVSRDSFAYKEYSIRLMLALISAKALQEKVLKLHGIRKLPGSPSFGGTL